MIRRKEGGGGGSGTQEEEPHLLGAGVICALSGRLADYPVVTPLLR